MEHVLTSTAVDSQEDARMESSPIGNTPNGLVAPGLESARLAERHQACPELLASHPLLCRAAVVTLGTSSDDRRSVAHHPRDQLVPARDAVSDLVLKV